MFMKRFPDLSLSGRVHVLWVVWPSMTIHHNSVLLLSQAQSDTGGVKIISSPGVLAIVGKLGPLDAYFWVGIDLLYPLFDPQFLINKIVTPVLTVFIEFWFFYPLFA